MSLRTRWQPDCEEKNAESREGAGQWKDVKSREGAREERMQSQEERQNQEKTMSWKGMKESRSVKRREGGGPQQCVEPKKSAVKQEETGADQLENT
ncbi:hypothetical protein NDU88_007497 [Pleurodeles waltl]|uniref:Uncharacterized protein n=1 Tax=Pleurodeles waltl TaxID=8319 RepID=A0AAV7NTS4_PLEWA|nr:hypothetical protein NDU88_007497 [Pleurodeles waltl]